MQLNLLLENLNSLWIIDYTKENYAKLIGNFGVNAEIFICDSVNDLISDGEILLDGQSNGSDIIWNIRVVAKDGVFYTYFFKELGGVSVLVIFHAEDNDKFTKVQEIAKTLIDCLDLNCLSDDSISLGSRKFKVTDWKLKPDSKWKFVKGDSFCNVCEYRDVSSSLIGSNVLLVEELTKGSDFFYKLYSIGDQFAQVMKIAGLVFFSFGNDTTRLYNSFEVCDE